MSTKKIHRNTIKRGTLYKLCYFPNCFHYVFCKKSFRSKEAFSTFFFSQLWCWNTPGSDWSQLEIQLLFNLTLLTNPWTMGLLSPSFRSSSSQWTFVVLIYCIIQWTPPHSGRGGEVKMRKCELWESEGPLELFQNWLKKAEILNKILRMRKFVDDEKKANNFLFFTFFCLANKFGFAIGDGILRKKSRFIQMRYCVLCFLL